MKSFAFVVYPKTIEQIKRFWPALRADIAARHGFDVWVPEAQVL